MSHRSDDTEVCCTLDCALASARTTSLSISTIDAMESSNLPQRITRTVSFGCLDFELSYPNTSEKEKEDLNMLFSVSSLATANDDDTANAADSPKKTYLRLHVATPQRMVSTAMKTFLSFHAP